MWIIIIEGECNIINIMYHIYGTVVMVISDNHIVC